MERGNYFQYLRNEFRALPYTTQRGHQLRPPQNQVNPPLQEEINNEELNRETSNSESDGGVDAEEEENDVQPHNEALSSESEEDLPQERHPIYEGCRLTKNESDLLIMAFLIRHGVTDVGLQDLLDLINCHLPRPYLNSTKYLFLKNFPRIVNPQTCYFCPDCLESLDFEEGQSVVRCESCRKRFFETDLNQGGFYFLHIPLKEQFSRLFSSPLFNVLQRENPPDDIISDVNTGEFYKKLKRDGIISNHDITIQWNTDGVNTFKSSKASMWPIQVAVNELPYRIRKQNILLAGLWCSTEKPMLNMYLQRFVNDLNDLHENGFQCLPPNFEEPITVKVHALFAPVDSVCRCMCQNIHQYNGEYGCPYCLNPGEHVPTGRGFSRVYCGGLGSERTEARHVKHCAKSEEQNRVVKGVKGASILMLLATFNIIQSFPPEYMHALLLGVVKLFLSTWIDPINSNKLWYINADKRKVLDKILLGILPPCEITRVPQTINNLKLWKASELKNFLLYYSLPALKDLIPVAHYKHWSLLVFAAHKLLSDKITQRDFNQAKTAMQKFVYDTELLYGKELMKFNVHLLLHIPTSVQYFGALWTWSAFPFESYNHVLRNMLSGSQYVLKQVCKSYLRLQGIKNNNSFFMKNCSEAGRRLFLTLMGKNVRYFEPIPQNRDDHHARQIKPFGKGTNVTLNLRQKLAIQALLLDENIHDRAVCYERFLHNGIVYHSCTYNRLRERNNSIIRMTTGSFISITAIVSASVEMTRVRRWVIIGRLYQILDNQLCTYNNDISSSSYCYTAHLTNNIASCHPEQVLSKCIAVPISNQDVSKCYIFPIVNTIETD